MYATHIKAIEVAARAGGADLDGNPALELAAPRPKQSVPNDNIDRAIKRGAGRTGEVVDYVEIMYEVRGPAGSALLIECLTDNRNRAASEVRATVTVMADKWLTPDLSPSCLNAGSSPCTGRKY